MLLVVVVAVILRLGWLLCYLLIPLTITTVSFFHWVSHPFTVLLALALLLVFQCTKRLRVFQPYY